MRIMCSALYVSSFAPSMCCTGARWAASSTASRSAHAPQVSGGRGGAAVTGTGGRTNFRRGEQLVGVRGQVLDEVVRGELGGHHRRRRRLLLEFAQSMASSAAISQQPTRSLRAATSRSRNRKLSAIFSASAAPGAAPAQAPGESTGVNRASR